MKERNLGLSDLTEKLGGGSFAEVYEVEIEGRAIALKVFKIGREEEAEKELLVGSDLVDDPTGVLVRLLDKEAVGVVDEYGRERMGVELEVIRGTTLLKSVKEGGRLNSWSETVEFFDNLVKALDFARGKDWVFTDLNAKAVMVDDEGEPKLIDLSSFGKVGTDDILFSEIYSDPKLYKYTRVIEQNSDIYPITGLLYLVITGVEPEPKSDLLVKTNRLGLNESQMKQIEKVLNGARGRRGLFGREFETARELIERLKKI